MGLAAGDGAISGDVGMIGTSSVKKYKLHIGSALPILQSLPDQSVDCWVTSPPYWGLRSYDENSVRIDPTLSAERRTWLEAELIKRGIYAR